ncbi:MAG: hypothetical protein RLZZ628_2255 [Bacteroidota bacterium]
MKSRGICSICAKISKKNAVMKKRAQPWIDIFLFSNVFISWIASGSSWLTATVFHLDLPPLFSTLLFFSTLSSYSLHWYLTPISITHSNRIIWTLSNKNILLKCFVVSSILTAILLILHFNLWIYFLPAAFLTLLYTAPKLPFRPFRHLQHWAIAKTLYLSVLWTFVTVLLPILSAKNAPALQGIHWIFIANRFLLIHPICILFDFRDRKEDKHHGIKSLITYASVKDLYFMLFFITIGFFGTLWFFFQQNLAFDLLISLAAPYMMVLLTFRHSIVTKSDYWFYGVMDGLILASTVILWIFKLHF